MSRGGLATVLAQLAASREKHLQQQANHLQRLLANAREAREAETAQRREEAAQNAAFNPQQRTHL